MIFIIKSFCHSKLYSVLEYYLCTTVVIENYFCPIVLLNKINSNDDHLAATMARKQNRYISTSLALLQFHICNFAVIGGRIYLPA